jgi:tetratricopeptide (TPR) repeat protein
MFFILGFLVYGNSLNNKFLMDDNFFLNNPVFSSTKFILSQWNPYREQALGVVDSHEIQSYYRPMQHMVLDLCYATFKNNYWQYHFLNFFLFVLASSLIYLFIERVTGNYIFAFLAGFFYLIHPINGIIVNYISASVFPFQIIFMLGSILLLWESLERNNNRLLYALSLLFSFLSIFWHETGIMAPFYVSAVVLLLRKGSFKEKAVYLFPYFLIVFCYIVFRFFFLSINDLILKRIALFHMTGWEYLAALFQIFAWYISKLFYPQGIVMMWAAPILHDHIIWYVLGACLLLMLFLLLFVRFTKEKILQMAIVWIVIGFIPVCLAAFRTPELGALIESHWFVFSSIGFFILASYFCMIILNQTKSGGVVLLFILIFTCGTVSRAYNQLWADPKTYALYWSQQAPDLNFVDFYLAYAYKEEGSFKESMKYYRMALSGTPLDFGIYNNLGEIDYLDGHLKEAELNYKRALRFYPHSSGVYNNLGQLYLTQGQWKKADVFLRQALFYNPLLLQPRKGLARIFLDHSDYQKAIDQCLMNLNIKSDDQDTLSILIYVYAQKKDFVSMKKYAYKILNDQTDPSVLIKLAIVMEESNEPEIALDCLKKVIKLAPDYKDAYLESGKLLEKLGKYDEAIRIWNIGSSIDPSDQRFKQDIVKAIKLKSK